MRILTFIATCILAVSALGENLLKNGDFELSQAPKDFRGFDYIPPAKQQFVSIDTAVKHSGKASIRISGVGETYVALIQKNCKMEDFKKPILIRGWAKYDNVVLKLPNGRIAGMPMVGLWTRNKKGGNGPSMGIAGFSEGSKDWFQFEQVFTPEAVRKRMAYLKGDNEIVSFTFRINIASQTGTFWFDDLEMQELDDEPLTASLLVKDISEGIAKIQITVTAPTAETTAVLSAGGKEVTVSLPQEKNIVEYSVAHLKEGANSLTITPKTGFPAETKAIELKFNKMANAFDED